jgi:hypothetical protein
MLGSVGLPIQDEPLLVCVGYLSSKGDLSAPPSQRRSARRRIEA